MDNDELKHRWDDVLARLKQERDELALKVHLGKLEAVAEWERLEAKWHEIKAGRIAEKDQAPEESSVGIGLALELAVQELKKDYERIRKVL